MSEEIKDVENMEAEPISAPSAEEVKQDSIDSEVVKPQNQEVQENLKRALQAERERRKEAENREAELKKELENKQPQYQTDDDAYQRFVKLEAEVKIQKKINEDKTFVDRKDLVIDTMEKTGLDVDSADAFVKAQLYDQLIKESKSEPNNEPVPNSIKTQATPEPIRPKKTGNVLDDVESGAMNVDPALRATILKYRKKD